MDAKLARAVAAEAFPHGPEHLVKLLKIDVRRRAVTGTDGWCSSGRGKTIITINSCAPEVRQRFTLAHELAHILLGTEPGVRSEMLLPFASNKREERAADSLASDLLVPIDILKAGIPRPPICATTIKRLAKECRVSQHVICAKIAAEAAEIGLTNAGVVYFAGREHRANYSPTLRFPRGSLLPWLEAAEQEHPLLLRRRQQSGEIATMALAGSPEHRVLLVQLLPAELGLAQTRHEESRRLGEDLFKEAPDLRNSLNGCLSMFKSRSEELSLDEAIETFNEQYSDRWTGPAGKAFRSKLGQAYLKARLSAWCVAEDAE